MGIGGSPGGSQLDKASFSVGRGRGTSFAVVQYDWGCGGSYMMKEKLLRNKRLCKAGEGVYVLGVGR